MATDTQAPAVHSDDADLSGVAVQSEEQAKTAEASTEVNAPEGDSQTSPETSGFGVNSS